MAKFFRFQPSEVDKIDKDQIMKLLWLEERWKEKESQEGKKAMNK